MTGVQTCALPIWILFYLFFLAINIALLFWYLFGIHLTDVAYDNLEGTIGVYAMPFFMFASNAAAILLLFVIAFITKEFTGIYKFLVYAWSALIFVIYIITYFSCNSTMRSAAKDPGRYYYDCCEDETVKCNNPRGYCLTLYHRLVESQWFFIMCLVIQGLYVVLHYLMINIESRALERYFGFYHYYISKFFNWLKYDSKVSDNSMTNYEPEPDVPMGFYQNVKAI